MLIGVAANFVVVAEKSFSEVVVAAVAVIKKADKYYFLDFVKNEKPVNPKCFCFTALKE